MADRHTLAVSQLDDFKKWLEIDGWVIQKPKGFWEVLRAIKADRKSPLILYRRTATNKGFSLVHYTVKDRDMGVVCAFLKDKKIPCAKKDLTRRFSVFREWSTKGPPEKHYDRCTISPAKAEEEKYNGENFACSYEGDDFFICDSLYEAIEQSMFNPFDILFEGLTDKELKEKDAILAKCIWTSEGKLKIIQ